MPNEKIASYYLLCAVKDKKARHPVNQLSKDQVKIFTKKELETYMREDDGVYKPREYVVGGEEPTKTVVGPCVLIY